MFFADYGQFNITNSTGMFLWSRTMSFANCAIIKPPADLVPLCPQNQPDHPTSPAPAWSVSALLDERSPADYLWAPGAWYRHDAHPGINAYNNKLATQFAERAILAQPLDYLKTVGKEVFLTFFATDRSESYLSDHFTVAPHVTTLAPYMKSYEYRYAHTTSNTHVVQPWAYFMFLYQMPVWFPGVVFCAVMVAGLVLLIRRWRGWGVYAGLAWGVAVVNLVVPIAAVELDYRYALSAVPFACLALGLACIRKPVRQAVATSAAPAARPPLRPPRAAVRLPRPSRPPAAPPPRLLRRTQRARSAASRPPVGFRPWQTRSGARTGSNWTTRPCASGTPRYSRPMPTGSCSTGPRSTPAAAASRRTTASCCGAACRPGSSMPARVTTFT